MSDKSISNGTRRGGRLLRNTAVFTVGKFISKLLVLLMTKLYTTCLTPAEYSRADLITTAANLLIPLACLGITEGVFRSTAGETDAGTGRREAYFTAGLVVLGFGSVGLIVLSPLIGLIPFLRDSVLLITAYVLVSNLHTLVSQYLCAAGHTTLFAGQGILNTLLNIAFNILFLPVLHWGIVGYVLSVIVADGLTTVFLVLYTRLWRSVKRLPWRQYRTVIRSLLTFSIFMVPTTVCWWITSVSDRYMVTAMRSEAENGLYAVAYKIPTLLTLAVGIFDSAWRLSVAAEQDREACCRYYSGVWGHYLTLAFVGGAVIMLLCRPFTQLLVAPAYSASWQYIPVLTVATMFCGLDTFLGSVYFTMMKPLWSMLTAMGAAGLNIGLNLALIPRLGAMGAALATFVSYFAAFVLRMITAYRLIPFDRRVGRVVINTALTGLLAVAVTATGGATALPAWLPWTAAGVLCAAVMTVNIRPLIRLCRELLHALRHTSARA